MTSTSGYSKTPLAKKLGIVEGSLVALRFAPADYEQLLEPIPRAVRFGRRITRSTDLVHVFATRRSVLEAELITLREKIRSNAVVWVSWPKKASKVPTDITEDTVRDVSLPLGFVDVKVCAVTETWSGLKLVIRKELR